MTLKHFSLLGAVAVGSFVAAGTAVWLTMSPPTQRTSVEACVKPVTGEQVTIPGGTFEMGSNEAYPEERPRRTVTVAAFRIDRHEVTNAEFAEFVAATGYVTLAERIPNPAQHRNVDVAKLVPGSALFVVPDHAVMDMEWWRFAPGANWRAPSGPGSHIYGRENYPVVHIAYEDAEAYAKWRGRRLPTEAEWERAAGGGRNNSPYIWGKELAPQGKWRANVWQGEFPVQNQGTDGFTGVAPVDCFDANGYGVYDMIGNVWEWTADAYAGKVEVGVIKGGSYLCSENFCARYRASARQPMERNFSTSHVGFRTVSDL